MKLLKRIITYPMSLIVTTIFNAVDDSMPENIFKKAWKNTDYEDEELKEDK